MSEEEIIFNITNAIEKAKKKDNYCYDVSMSVYSNKLIEGLLDLYQKEKEYYEIANARIKWAEEYKEETLDSMQININEILEE